MARYIDADRLREKMFHKAFEEDSPDQKWDSGCWIRYHMFEDTIESIPTADVVEVVRCRECKFYLHSAEKCGLIDTRLHFYETDKRWTDECFCSWGERREDG